MDGSFYAELKSADSGSFTAVASSPTLDADGEVLVARCFEPLPTEIPVKAGHDHPLVTGDRPERIVATARPAYRGDTLYLDGRFHQTQPAQDMYRLARDRAALGLSVVFTKPVKETKGATTYVKKGRLVGCDFVTNPANEDARLVSVKARSLGGTVSRTLAEATRMLEWQDRAGRAAPPPPEPEPQIPSVPDWVARRREADEVERLRPERDRAVARSRQGFEDEFPAQMSLDEAASRRWVPVGGTASYSTAGEVKRFEVWRRLAGRGPALDASGPDYLRAEGADVLVRRGDHDEFVHKDERGPVVDGMVLGRAVVPRRWPGYAGEEPEPDKVEPLTVPGDVFADDGYWEGRV